jgi:hypothetical protein
MLQNKDLMKVKLPVKTPDFVIILLAIGLTVFSAFTAYVKPENTTQVVIEGANQKWIFPLDAEETVNVKGPIGTTVIKIHGNEAWVESSPCKNLTCVGMGHAHSNGQWVACLSNNVFLIIRGSNDSKELTDAVAW